MSVRPRLALLALLALGACATTPEPKWEERAGANLQTDLAACVAEARQVDINSPQGHAYASTGAAAAAAGYIDQSDMRGGGAERLFAAVRDACMSRKGWKRIG